MAASLDSSPPAETPVAAGGILVIVAHPELEQSRVTRMLLDAARAAQAERGDAEVTVRDLYALYPDYCIDTPLEQAALAAARLVVWLQPIHWYGMTPLLKLWCDDVLTFGWAYGPGGEAMRGKDVWLVASTGGPQDSYHPSSYNRYYFDAFLPPYEQTAALCGMRFLPPLILHGAVRAGPAEVGEHARTFAERIASYPDWPEISELDACPTCVVPFGVRPLDDDRTGVAFGKAA